MRRTVRGIIWRDGRLILIKRQKVGAPPYYVFPGGGVETHDATLESALRREIREELGCDLAHIRPGPVLQHELSNGLRVEYFFYCDLVGLVTRFAGSEASEPGRGSYELMEISSTNELELLNVLPAEIKSELIGNWPT